MREWARRLLAAAGAIAVLWPAAWHLGTLAAVFRARLAYPQDIEWMEGGNVYQAYRVLHGLPLYVAPQTGFAPYPYPPLYWVATAVVGRLFGLDYATGRAVSVACIGGAALLLAVAVARHAPGRWLGVAFGLVAMAAIAAGYPAAGGSYDIARNDAMAVALPIAAAALLRDGRISLRRSIGVAALLVAALYTKQTAIFFVVWLLVFATARDARGGARLAGIVALGSLACFAWLQLTTGGWFGVWLFDMRHHPLEVESWTNTFASALPHAPFLVLVPLLAVWLRRRRWLRASSVKWAGMLGAALALALVVQFKRGSWLNTYVPVLVLSWPATLVLVGDLLTGLARRPVARAATAWVVLAAAGAFLWHLRYAADAFVPGPERWDRAARLETFIRGLPGGVVVATDPFVAIRAGKTCAQPNFQAYADATNGGIEADYVAALAKSDTAWVILTGRYFEAEVNLPGRMSPRFERVGDLGFAIDSMATWDRPPNATLWRRALAP